MFPSERPACPKCGRFISWASCGAIVDVLTVPGVDILRDVANCKRCGLVEYVVRPVSLGGAA
jgi:ribosomal protein S27AE